MSRSRAFKSIAISPFVTNIKSDFSLLHRLLNPPLDRATSEPSFSLPPTPFPPGFSLGRANPRFDPGPLQTTRGNEANPGAGVAALE